MKRTLTVMAMVLALALSALAPAMATVDEPDPGDVNCKGQAIAFLSQVNRDFDRPGFAHIAELSGLSVKEAVQLAEAICEGSA